MPTGGDQVGCYGVGQAGGPGVGQAGGPGVEQINDCGSLCCYADDSTFTISSKDPSELSRKISEKYNNLSVYMQNNKLVLNSDKTHVLVLASAHKHRRYGDFEIELDTGNETIKPVDCEILLGASLSNNFQWNQHVRDGKKAILSSLNKKNTALVKIAQITDFKTRKNIGTSLIMPTLSYIIEVYGSCSEYLLDALQVQQNKAAKIITKLPFRTPTQTFLLQCDWLSVRQLVKYCLLTLLHKTR